MDESSVEELHKPPQALRHQCLDDSHDGKLAVEMNLKKVVNVCPYVITEYVVKDTQSILSEH